MKRQYEDVAEALRLIFRGIEMLQGACTNGRQFTIDGRLVGDIGELVAAREFDINLDQVSRKHYDATTPEGVNVQIKATFKKLLTFTVEPELYLGLLLRRDGSHEVIYNGPGHYITKRFKSRRKSFGQKLISLPIEELKAISASIPDHERIRARA